MQNVPMGKQTLIGPAMFSTRPVRMSFKKFKGLRVAWQESLFNMFKALGLAPNMVKQTTQEPTQLKSTRKPLTQEITL